MFYRARRRLESRRGKHECSRHVVAHALFACRLGTLAETFGIRSLRTHLTKLSDIAHSCVPCSHSCEHKLAESNEARSACAPRIFIAFDRPRSRFSTPSFR